MKKPASTALALILFCASGYTQTSLKTDSIPVNDSTWIALPEVMVKGERPVIKVEDGKLNYNIPLLVKDKPVTNAYEVLKEIPGMMEQNDVLSLAGTSGVTFLINGQKTNLTYEQIMSVLKSTPASRIGNVEIMYSAPPQYNVRGAAVNLLFTDPSVGTDMWQGEISGTFEQKYYSQGSGRANLIFSNNGFTADIMYAYNNTQVRMKEEMLSYPLFKEQRYDIKQLNLGHAQFPNHNIRAAIEYGFKNKDKISASYTGQYTDTENRRMSDMTLRKNKSDNNDVYKIFTDNTVKGPSKLHNIQLDYQSHFGLNIGGNYTYYNDNSTQDMENTPQLEGLPHFINSESEQEVKKAMVYINMTHDLAHNWNLNYGGNATYTHSRNISSSYMDGNVDDEASFLGKQQEMTANLFVGFSKSFNDKFSVQASVSSEYYKTTEKERNIEKTLWKDIAFFPNANISYVFCPEHILQLSLSSDKQYPSYWILNPTVYHINAYSEIQGSPDLQPSRKYNTSLQYILKQKYVFIAYFNYQPDYFTQMGYQSSDELKTVFKQFNFKYKRDMGITLVIPFRVKEILNSTLVLNGNYLTERCDDFYDIPFNRSKWFNVVQLNNDIKISTKPDLKLNVSGYYTTKAIQGIMDLGSTYNVSAGVTWTFDKGRAKLIIKGNDLFNSTTPTVNTNYKGQLSRMNITPDSRTLNISFIYRFGGFKEKEKKEIDTSRFGSSM